MRIKTTVFYLLLVYWCGGCKTGWDLETEALNRIILNRSDTIYQFYTIKPTDKSSGVKESDYYYWFRPDTILVTRGGFDGKLLHGEYRSFYPNKNLKENGRFEYGLKTGEWKSWFSNGELQAVSKWHTGKKEGRFQEFSPNGQLLRAGYYRNNKLYGYLTTYAGDSVVNTLYYRNGNPVIQEKKTDSTKRSTPNAAQK
jgi:hypothetical protein